MGSALQAVPPDEVAVEQLHRWTTSLSAVTVDLVQNSETFYFRETDPRLGLASLLHGLDQLTSASEDGEAGSSDRRVALRSLDEALDHLVSVLGSQFGLPAQRRGVLDALAEERAHDE